MREDIFKQKGHRKYKISATKISCTLFRRLDTNKIGGENSFVQLYSLS